MPHVKSPCVVSSATASCNDGKEEGNGKKIAKVCYKFMYKTVITYMYRFPLVKLSVKTTQPQALIFPMQFYAECGGDAMFLHNKHKQKED